VSHVVKIKLVITDLEALQLAAAELGLEMVRQDTYKWFGRYMADSPLPEDFTTADLGRCEYALRIPGKPNAYEVGVARRKDGAGYELLWDYWQGGYGLETVIGEGAQTLKRAYNLTVAEREMRRKGFRTARAHHPMTGKPRLKAWRA
jgi:hypothetical protein